MNAARCLLPAVALGLLALVAAPPAPAQEAGWSPRGEDYASTARVSDLPIATSDGTILRADRLSPADAAGRIVDDRLPVVVTITAYNKGVLASGAGAMLAGGEPGYLAKRGYHELVVDARGTGTSQGTWQVFGEREQLDAKEIVEWAAEQPWSDGSVAMAGASYMGISQLFAAGQRPKGLKAIFPQVPSAEVYRDVVAAGGQLDVGFMPLWLGLVSLTSLGPPPLSGEVPPEEMLANVLTHLTGTGGTSLDLLLKAALGGEQTWDGPYYEERSTLLRSVPTIDVPTFLVGGHYDLFQRGTPLVFEGLHRRGVPVKMILGPWHHLDGSSGTELGEAGYGSLNEVRLRWFDHYVKGLPDPALHTDIADFTYYELGSQRWVKRDAYLDTQRAKVFHLSGTSGLGGSPGELVAEGAVAPGASPVLPLAVAGLCSRSTTQWTAGIPSVAGIASPCENDHALNDALGVVFESDPLAEELRFLGPIGARIYVSSTTGDGYLVVRLSRVGADGRVEPLTNGWQVISLRELDESRSRILDGEIIQPWHPFTRASQSRLGAGEIAPVDVEVFPTGAALGAGERLRLSIQSFDLPHAVPSLQHVLGTVGVLRIHNSAEHPSRIVLPAFTGEAASGAGGQDPGGAGEGSGDPDDRDETALGGGAGGQIVSDLLPGTGSASPLASLLFFSALLIAAGTALARRFWLAPQEPAIERPPHTALRDRRRR